MSELYDKLIELKNSDYYPMHMPGHKRNPVFCEMGNPYEIDITEIPGFDNLHQPEGLLLSLSERLSRLYGSRRAFPLVNGSTVGILAGISAAVNRGDKVLLQRNAHKSVYHALILMGLIPVYCYPQIIKGTTLYGGILPEDIRASLIKHPDIRLVILTSPTYEGIVSDIGSIAELVHSHGARLLVDEAHGAHFGFHPGFPESAVRKGADLVIQSLHKTLPAFTQTAVLHTNSTDLIPLLEKYLAIYESSSPSYLLMAGMDRCVSLLEEQAEELFEAYEKRLERFYYSMNQLKCLRVLKPDRSEEYGIYAFDRSKITVSVRGASITGPQLHRLLHDSYHIVFEMEAPEYVLGMTSICDTEEGFLRMEQALLAIDRELERTSEKAVTRTKTQGTKDSESNDWELGLQAMLPSQAWELPSEQISFQESEGRISAAFLCLFPPGAPILVPGEVINQELIIYLQKVIQEGITVTGLTGEQRDSIEVLLR